MGGNRDKGSSLDRSSVSNTSSAGSSLERDVKVVVAGPAKCGKTALIQRFVNDHFNDVSTIN